jgi:hypothetical protein
MTVSLIDVSAVMMALLQREKVHSTWLPLMTVNYAMRLMAGHLQQELIMMQ